MTDGQLISLVEETPADELSPEQIAALRRRLPHSPELREALAGQLRLEQTLNAALGTPHVSIDAILAQAAASTAAAGLGRLFGWGSGAALVIAVTTVGLVLQKPWAAAPVAAPVAAANRREAVARPPAELAAVAAPAEHLARGGLAEALEPNAPAEAAEAASPSDAVALLPTNRVAELAAATGKAPPQALDDDPIALDPGGVEAEFFEELAWPGFEPLEEQLEALEGAHERLMENRSRGPALKLAELSHLRPGWPAGTALRLRLGESAGVRLHFYSGLQGLTLERHAAPPGWAIYRTTRRADKARPQSLALWATDADRYRRTGGGTIDVRWQSGELVLSRGDVSLAVVGCPTQPETIYFEGPAELCGLAFVRCHSLTLPRPPAEAEPCIPPVELSWTKHLPPGAEWNALAAGRLELLAEDTAETCWAATRVADPGLHEVIFQLEDPLPGTGIYLGDDAGRPLHQLGFFRDERSGQTCFGFTAPGDLHSLTGVDRRQSADGSHADRQGPVAFADVRPWLRLTLGGGRLRCWTSGDGRHWSPALEPLGGLSSGYATVGLYALAGGGTRCLRIRRLETRRLATLAGLAAPELRAQVSELSHATSAAAWQESVRQNCPPGVAADSWRLACAVDLLAAGDRSELASPILLELLEQTLGDERFTARERLALLDEAALVFDASEPAWLQAFLGCYERLAHALAREGKTQAYSRVRRALLVSPLSTPIAFDALPAGLIESELAELSAAGDAAALRALASRLEFFGGGEHAEIRRLVAEAFDRLSAED